VYRRSSLLLLLLSLFSGVALADVAQTGAKVPTGDVEITNSRSSGMQEFHLKGVLVSRSGGLALINGKMSRVGDRLANAEIVAITEGAIRISAGSRERTVYVGATFAAESAAPSSSAGSRRIKRQRPALLASPPDTRHSGRPGVEQHAVVRGETLSGISKRFALDGVTLNQMVVALFRENPKAFDGNINRLREGASLRIPARDDLLLDGPDAAAAEVARQTDEWRMRHQRPTRLAEVGTPRQYGPVSAGETLSGIAERTLPEGVTTDQMMIAVYESNRAAFGDNINILYEGAVLQLPIDGAMLQRPEIAAAEVLRQTNAWRSADRRQARPTEQYANTTASSLDWLRSGSGPSP